MVKYVKSNGKVVNLNREKFVKLMKVLKKRAKANKEQRIIAEMTAHWN